MNVDDFIELLEYLNNKITDTINDNISFHEFFRLAEQTIPEYIYKMDLAEAFVPEKRKDENGEYFYNHNLGYKIAAEDVVYLDEYSLYQLLDYRSFLNIYHYSYRYDVLRTNLKTGDE